MAGLNYHKMYNNVRLLISAHHGWRPIFLLSANIKTPRRGGQTKERGTLASKHTEHYGLNQWEANDQVLHSDFNEDNAKIDAALGVIGHVEKLWSLTLDRDKNSVDVPLDTIDWSDWQFIAVTVDIPKTRITSTYPTQSCTLNGNTMPCRCTGESDRFASFYCASALIVFFPFHGPQNPVIGMYVANPSGVSFGEGLFRELKQLDFGSSSPFPANSVFTLWGCH